MLVNNYCNEIAHMRQTVEEMLRNEVMQSRMEALNMCASSAMNRRTMSLEDVERTDGRDVNIPSMLLRQLLSGLEKVMVHLNGIDPDPPPATGTRARNAAHPGVLYQQDRAHIEAMLSTIEGLWRHRSGTSCKFSCITCLQKKANKVKLHQAETMLATEGARLQRLIQCLQKLLSYIAPPRRTRRALLEDSVIGSCLYDGQEYDVACCIIDIASNWSLGTRMTEFGKIFTRTGGAQRWLHLNDWGVSAKPPDIYGQRFQHAINSYFMVSRPPREEALEKRWKWCSPLLPADFCLEVLYDDSLYHGGEAMMPDGLALETPGEDEQIVQQVAGLEIGEVMALPSRHTSSQHGRSRAFSRETQQNIEDQEKAFAQRHMDEMEHNEELPEERHEIAEVRSAGSYPKDFSGSALEGFILGPTLTIRGTAPQDQELSRSRSKSSDTQCNIDAQKAASDRRQKGGRTTLQR